MLVAAPGVNHAILGKGHYMVRAGSNRLNIIQYSAVTIAHFAGAASAGDQIRILIGPLLSLLVVAPGPHGTVGFEYHREALAHVQGGNCMIGIRGLPLCHCDLVQHLDPKDQRMTRRLIQNLDHHNAGLVGDKRSPLYRNNLGISGDDLDVVQTIIVDIILLRIFPQQEPGDLAFSQAPQFNPVALTEVMLHMDPLAQEDLGLYCSIFTDDHSRYLRLHRLIRAAFHNMVPLDGRHFTQLAHMFKRNRILRRIALQDLPAATPGIGTAIHIQRDTESLSGADPGSVLKFYLLIEVGPLLRLQVHNGARGLYPYRAHDPVLIGRFYYRNAKLAVIVPAKAVYRPVHHIVSIHLTPNDEGMISSSRHSHRVGDLMEAVAGRIIIVKFIGPGIIGRVKRDSPGLTHIRRIYGQTQLTIPVAAHSQDSPIRHQQEGMLLAYRYVHYSVYISTSIISSSGLHRRAIGQVVLTQLTAGIVAPSEKTAGGVNGKGLLPSGKDLFHIGQGNAHLAHGDQRGYGINVSIIVSFAVEYIAISQLAFIIITPAVGITVRRRQRVQFACRNADGVVEAFSTAGPTQDLAG